MKRHSYANGFVIFPHSGMEDEWSRTQNRIADPVTLARKFQRVLDTADDEQTVQSFLEDHPQMLPALMHYHNGPRGDLVICKLPLGHDFVCDFAYASENSQCIQFTCVEIESPTKRLFNRDGSFTADYFHARQQIADWNAWAQYNLRAVLDSFDRLGRYANQRDYTISLRCYLVMGRRSELTTVKRRQRWAAEHALSQSSLHMMTYDRLLTDAEHSFYQWKKRLLVCQYRDRALHVKQISK
jgi:hypothetical protein